jgi:hypothetical protein
VGDGDGAGARALATGARRAADPTGPAERSRPPSLNSRPNELDFYHNFLYSENLIKLSRFFSI